MVIGSLVGCAKPARRQNPVRRGEAPGPASRVKPGGRRRRRKTMFQYDVQASPVLFCGKFPGRREKCREFRRFGRFLRKCVSKTDANPVSCETNSLRRRAGK